MVIFRFTRKLLNKGFTIADNKELRSDTLFGDWYADYLYASAFHVILFTSERTLLPIVITSAPKQTIIERFIEQLKLFLTIKDMNAYKINIEISKMKEYQISKTINRRVLGTMNEFKIEMTNYSYNKYPESRILLSSEMAEMPCGAIDMEQPINLVMKMLSNS